MTRTSGLGALVFTAVLAASAHAQDFGTQWIDRITHELIDDDLHLSSHPLDLKATIGELYSYDTNIFLDHQNAKKDSIFLTFGDVGLKYAQPEFDVEADLTVNYNAYASQSNADTDEERFFGRARYQGPKLMIGGAEIFQRVSSPTDVVFTHRVQRLQSDTVPEAAYHFNEVLSIEAQSTVEFVRFQRHEFQTADNLNSRSSATVAYKTEWCNLEALFQGGYITIGYPDSAAPPNSDGYFVRVGGRGEVAPGVHLIALAGFTSELSKDFPGTRQRASYKTSDIELHLSCTLTELVTAYIDYTRRFSYSAAGAPFEVVNASDIIAELALRDDFKIRARLQYEKAIPIPGPDREYYSAGLGAEYRIVTHILLDAGATYRIGVTPNTGGVSNFHDAIISVGIAATF